MNQNPKGLTQAGFTLVEVVIALVMFAIFATAFLVSQGYNVSDSTLSEEQLRLHMLCEQKIQEIAINPPRFNNTMVDLKETKAFDEADYKDYSWTIEWKKLKIPDLGKLISETAKEEGEPDPGDDPGLKSTAGLQKMIFTQLKENVERTIWQLRITATYKPTNYSYTLSRWITNYDEQVKLNLSL